MDLTACTHLEDINTVTLVKGLEKLVVYIRDDIIQDLFTIFNLIYRKL